MRENGSEGEGEVPRSILLWRNAREDAEMVLRQAEESSIYIKGTAPILTPSIHSRDGKDEMFSRLKHGLRLAREYHGGDHHGIAYIGSTLCPRWRWEGGYSFRDDRRRAEFISGHRCRCDRMVVVASYPDKETAEAERLATLWAEPSGLINNRAKDARGLCIRNYAYSFMYLCY
eukprot:5853558-Pyramimonas_sp.AAC.1